MPSKSRGGWVGGWVDRKARDDYACPFPYPSTHPPRGTKSYYVNLDPAVKSVPFAANIDIRDTVNYREVMKQYELGPNGAIMTSLNLFATRFDQVGGWVGGWVGGCMRSAGLFMPLSLCVYTAIHPSIPSSTHTTF